MIQFNFFFIFILALSIKCSSCRHYTENDIRKLREEVREMFNHAYNGYLQHGYPFDELRPLSCDGVDTWGSYSLTLIDALDTLAVMGNHSEFRRVVELLLQNKEFLAKNINVSVFETNIRIIGGLLSSHLLSYKAGVQVERGWPCNGPLLELAETVAHKLVEAFDTKTGMPYGTVNLLHGVPQNETTVTCAAGVGTFVLEFATLSRLTGDPLYEELAMNALDALWHYKSMIGLVGNHVDIASGKWTAQDSGVGAGIDSYFEYLAKGAIFLQKPRLLHMFNEYKKKIEKYLKMDDWYVWASMSKGQVSQMVFQSLEAYWPGVLSLIGEVPSALRTIHNYHSVWKQFGFTPEFYNIPQMDTGAHRESYPLRPELIESVMYLYRATGDQYLLQVGEDILRSIQHSSFTSCGYATVSLGIIKIKDVRDHRRDDRMESFFLAETTKYLYLLFDPDNFIHNNGQHGSVVDTPWGDCIIDAGGYFFNTEAHPMDNGALQCCSRNVKDPMGDLLDFDPSVDMGEKLNDHRKRIALEKKLKMERDHTLSENKGQFPSKLAKQGDVTVVRLEKSDSGTQERDKAAINLTESGPIGIGDNKESSEQITSYIYQADQDHNKTLSGTRAVRAASSPLGPPGQSAQATTEPWPSQSHLDFTDKFNITAILESIFYTGHTNVFEPQSVLEKVRNEKQYERNASWEEDFKVLRCPAQSYLYRMTVNGQFYAVTPR